MSFSIYTLGDVTLFESALKGVAMMFTVARGSNISLWASDTNLGVGMGAVFGGLIALIVMIYNGALKRQLDWRNLLLPTLLYVALTGPKTTVTIIDAYSREPAREVSGVPVGLAFPLGMISQLAYTATEKLETVYQVPYAGFTKLTDEGFVAPLKILNAIRYSGVAFGGASPDFQGILTNIYKVCLVNNEAFDTNAYNSNVDPFNVLKTALNDPAVSNRSVLITTTGGSITTKAMSCPDTAKLLENSMNAYVTGTNNNDAFSILTNDELKLNNLSRDLDRIMSKQNGGSKQGVSEMSEGKILDTLSKFTTPNNETIMQYMYGALLNTSLSGVTQCSYNESKSALTKCQSYLTAIEQWKDQSAAEGTGFVTIMRDGQNLLIVLSIILFPIMVLVLIIQGAGSLKVMGSFILYTVSAFMWLPVASIINYYIHLQLHEEFLKWNPTGDPTMLLSIKNSSGFYDAISQKLALANQALASVPIICIGLFSGMLFAMNRLTDKWNHASNTFDPKVNMPDAVARAPIVNVSPSMSYQNANAVGTINGLSKTFNANTSHEISNALAEVKTAEQRSSMAHQRLFSHQLTQSLSKDELMSVSRSAIEAYSGGVRNSNTLNKLTSDVYETNFGSKNKTTNAANEDHGSQTEDNVFANSGKKLSGDIGAGASYGVKRDAYASPDARQNQRPAKFEAGGQVGVSATANHDIGEAQRIIPEKDVSTEKLQIRNAATDSTRGSYTDTTANAYQNADFSSHAFQSVLASKLEEAVSEKYGSNMSNALGTSFQQTFSEASDASRTVSEKYGTAFQHSRSTGELFNAMATDKNLVPNMQTAINEGRSIDPERFAQREQINYQNLKNSANGAVNENDLKLVSQFQALKDMGFEGKKLALEAEYGTYNLGQFDKPLENVKGQVEQGIGNAQEQVARAMNQNYDPSAKIAAIRAEREAIASQTTENANKPSYSYGTVGDIYRNEPMPKNNNAYDSIISRASSKYGVPEGLIKAVIHTESGFNPNATSPVNAEGLMQLMPQYHKERGVSNGYNPEQNIMGGTKYLKQMLNKFDGDIDLALAAYNAGAGNVIKHGGIPPFQETQEYVGKVKGRYNNLYKNGVGGEASEVNARAAALAK